MLNTEQAAAELRDTGFVLLKGIFSEAELQPLRQLTDRIVAYAEQHLEDPFADYYLRHRSDQGVLYDLFQRHPEFQSVARKKELLDVLEGVIGKDIFMYENCLVYKPKGKNNAVPWHQDFINRPNEPVKYISWVAMDDVTIDNGAMKLIPGSHRKGFLPMYRVKGETHHDRIKPEYIEEDKAQYVTMQAGDALLFNQLVVHSSDLVNSTKPRRAFRASYQSFEQR